MRKIILSFFMACFLFSCSNEKSNDKKDSLTQDTVKLVPAFSEWHLLTDSWTAALNLKNASIMKSFYADTVMYYGNKISGDEVVKSQQEYFAANTDYRLKIIEYISEEQQPDGTWHIRFTKQVTAGGKTADYPASLVFAKQNGIWKIISESDDITDLKKRTPVTMHYEPETVTVEGLLKAERAVKNKNEETYFTLWTAHPLHVIATAAQEKEGINVSEEGIDRIQLNGDETQLKALLNKKVQVSGTLFHSHTSYHYTTVLMNVSSIIAIN